MLKPTFPFLASKADSAACIWQLVGLPYDQTSSYRRGAQFGPEQLRLASDSIESFSPYCRKDLEDLRFFDAGDLPIAQHPPQQAVQEISDYYLEQTKAGKRILGIGGEHTVTIGAVQGLVQAGVKPSVLHLDAHFDLRQEYTGGIYSHASVIRRLAELVGAENVIQWGIRSGERSEFELAETQGSYIGCDLDSLLSAIDRLRGKPIYFTLDLDVFDPAELPGVGNPEPGGLKFFDFLKIAAQLTRLDVVGADVVELSPIWDTTGRSSIFAAEVVRELLLAIIR
ncbi:MAG: agmatinase [bacterium]|nr:agmatinase [bacterium]